MKPAACAVDEIASRLAAHAGIEWTTLGEHPGYSRNMYREQAQQMIRAVGALTDAPGATMRFDRGTIIGG